VNAEQRTCPSCGTEFTWTPAAPRQKFCSPRCKHHWHDRYGKKRDRRRRAGPTPDVARPPAGAGGGAASHPAPPQPSTGLAAAPACPHCRQPVALVAWLVPPAASITTPPQHISNTPRRDGP
jgi:endogenous inhibitor of DNA gyrase (YacG/DUF329 family)